MASSSSKPPPSAPEPQYIGFECRLCQTRMYALPDDVGKNVKCPDCGTKTPVPRPTVVKAKRMPTALEGEQYELWDADTAPLPSEMLAAQPAYIAMECRMCQTLFYGTPEQVGKELACPDCGTKHVVPPPKAPIKPNHRLVDEDEEIGLDESSPPPEPPVVAAPPRRLLLYEAEAEQERERNFRAARHGKKRAWQVDAQGRPVMPRFPLISGIVPFLWSPGVPVRWALLSVVAMIAVVLGALGVGAIGTGSSRVEVGMGAIAGVCFFIIGCITAAFWLAAFASIVLAIVVESSEGNHRIHQWPPPNPVEWLPEMIYIVVAGFVCLFPGWLLARLVPGTAEVGVLLVAGGAVLALPIVILSQLEFDSPFAVVSSHVLASVVRCPLSWLLFYAEVALVAAICMATTFYLATLAPGAMPLLVPLYVAALIVSARLLGRLSWGLAEEMSVEDTRPAASGKDSK